MEIASRNTMSYLSPIGFWGKITNIFNCCQTKTIEEQYDSGCRYFDLKIQFDETYTRRIIFCSGSTRYRTFSLYEILNFLNKKKDTYVRLTLETKSTRDINFQISRFKEVCRISKEIYPFITFFGGSMSPSNEIIYNFKSLDI